MTKIEQLFANLQINLGFWGYDILGHLVELKSGAPTGVADMHSQTCHLHWIEIDTGTAQLNGSK